MERSVGCNDLATCKITCSPVHGGRFESTDGESTPVFCCRQRRGGIFFLLIALIRVWVVIMYVCHISVTEVGSRFDQDLNPHNDRQAHVSHTILDGNKAWTCCSTGCRCHLYKCVLEEGANVYLSMNLYTEGEVDSLAFVR